jgi:transcriptional regulator with XRE-family HTH domain
MNQYEENVRKRINQLIEERADGSVSEFARKTNIAKSTVSRWQRGLSTPDADNIRTIADTFGVNPAWVLGYDAPMIPEKVWVTDIVTEDTVKGAAKRKGWSRYHIDTEITTTINGTEYHKRIDRTVHMNLSATKYNTHVLADEKETEIMLVPCSMEGFKELTEIFSPSEYSIKLEQSVFGKKVPHISLYLCITRISTDEKVYFYDAIQLSDGDYEYMRKTLIKECPQYKWMTADEYLHTEMEHFIRESYMYELFTDNAMESLVSMIMKRYGNIKMDGIVDFTTAALEESAVELLENVLRDAERKFK